MFEHIARRFLDHTFHPKPPVLTVPKIVTYLCLSLTGIHSLQIRTQISRLFFLILTLDSFFVLQDESPPFLPSRIEFPNT